MNEISKKTNVTGIFFTLFMFIVIIAGYYVEVIRGNRTMGVILFLGASLLVIYGTAFALYKKDPETKKISYLLIFGFLIPYGYTLLTSVSVIAFDFVAPVFIISFMFFERKLITTLTAIVGVMNILFVRKKNDIIKLMRNLAEVSENNSSATQELSASIEEQTAGIE